MISFLRSAPLRTWCIVASFALTAGEIGRTSRVSMVHTPNGGEPVEARLGSDGTIHLLYDSAPDGIPYYVKSSDGGATFSSQIPVVDKSSRKPGLIFSGASIAVGRRGAVYVAMMTNNWKVKIPGVPEGMAFAVLEAGAKAFTPVRSLNGQPSEGFSIAADDKGRVAATWLSGKLYAKSSQDDGKTFTANAEIDPSYAPCECCTTRAVYGPDGNLAVLYRESTNNQRDMYLVVIKNDGSKVRTRISSTLWEINGCPMTYYSVSATEKGYIAAWPTKGEIYFTHVDVNGKVAPPGEIKTAGRTGMRTGLVALEASDGTDLIAWKHQGELSWQLYASNGQPLDAQNSVPSAGKGTAGVVDKNGKFILFQ